MYSATYSPEDNKLRLYASSRLDKVLYDRVRAAGFIWAPKQDLFVAPAWSPAREDLLLELAGQIDDEDKSLVERQEERAERFEGYNEARAEDAEQARAAVHRICDGIPLGQPILVGHHSEKHARKDAERIENGMRRAVKMWETAEYWKDRAAGAIRHAKYKERPDVRARRIKGIETDRRRVVNHKTSSLGKIAAWENCLLLPEDQQHSNALSIANCAHGGLYFKFPADKYPRREGQRVYEDDMSIWSALDQGIITGTQAAELCIPVYQQYIPRADRWIAHYDNRLTYEKAMLDEQGASDLLKPKARAPQLPLCNYRVPEGLDIPNVWRNGELMHYPIMEMTQAEYAKINHDYKGTRAVGRSHRVRTAMRNHSLYYVFLTDAKTHTPPEPIAPQAEPKHREIIYKEPEPQPQAEAFDAMKQSLRAGVQVVSANQLFPTPPDLAARMVELAEIEPYDRVLEPSAGTGNILRAIGPSADKVAVEVNPRVVDALLARGFSDLRIHQGDFLECNGDLGTFDRVVMNPPFENASDVKHIKHALSMLRPGGRLVAICANGPRQQEQLQPLADMWEELPAGTFEGTGVRTVLLRIEKGEV